MREATVLPGSKVDIERPIYTRSYQDFWPYFMNCHEHPWTQRLHVVATLVALTCVLVIFPRTHNVVWLVAGPLLGYPIAWFSHLVFEKKKPAAWSHPYWSFLCDLDMMAFMLVGAMQTEMQRLKREPGARFSPGRRVVHHATEVAMLVAVLAILVLGLKGDLVLANPFAGP